MSASVAPTTPLSTGNEPDRAGVGLSLTALLDLVGVPADRAPASGWPAPIRRTAGWSATGLRERLRTWVQRAANWGAGPQGAWCAW
ncbi:hypothetical protein DQ238_14595 [Geodermatophilus sp. TF02-6]|uniref:hypothetical protein n=1 Tax=Geodermatophilus sp. TF02-6 TaxID=2250575 RepID=UPI000DE9F6DA|nr:hypothetical protein [Geodermatophilus sp. TF02-6]RBY77635.1 hypothetical protein DQ238_14595 [Geodermatophilus sp. TF02-6]